MGGTKTDRGRETWRGGRALLTGWPGSSSGENGWMLKLCMSRHKEGGGAGWPGAAQALDLGVLGGQRYSKAAG